MPPPRICLINMPFASLEAPSIALTQLQAVLEEKLGNRVSIETLYLDLDFVDFLGGSESYRGMTSSHSRLSGAADWFFRQAAFPDAEDNTNAFLDRFFYDEEDEEVRRTRQLILEKRPAVGEYLDRLIDRHRLADATLVGFTALFFQTMASFALARRIKERSPEVTTVIGGAACEAEMGLEFARRVEPIDYVFSGPALVSFPDFIEKRLAGDLEGCDRIDGVFSKTNLTSVTPTGSCPSEPTGESGALAIRLTGTERNINAAVPLNYDGFLDRLEATFPNGEVRPMLLFETSRGCSWGEKVACTFCGLNGTAMHYRSMVPENALAHLQSLFDYQPRCHFFLGVDTIVPGDYLDEVFPKLEPPPGSALLYEVRPTLSDEALATLVGAGVLVIQPGIESLSTDTLRLMRKGSTAFSNIAFLKRCARHPLRVEWNLLIGSPGESEAARDKILRDLPLLSHLHPPGGAFPISFDRFSQYFNQPEAWQLDLAPHEFYQFVWPFESEALEKIAYHFVDRNRSPDRINPWLDRFNEAIGHWWTRWENRDDQNESRLDLIQEGNEFRIHDSRNGDVNEYALSQKRAALLRHLESPRRFRPVASRFGPDHTERAMAFFRENGLLFEEDGRMMSLVITH